MKKVQKVLALLLVFMMVFTTAGMNVAAAGEMDSVAGYTITGATADFR